MAITLFVLVNYIFGSFTSGNMIKSTRVLNTYRCIFFPFHFFYISINGGTVTSYELHQFAFFFVKIRTYFLGKNIIAFSFASIIGIIYLLSAIFFSTYGGVVCIDLMH